MAIIIDTINVIKCVRFVELPWGPLKLTTNSLNSFVNATAVEFCASAILVKLEFTII